MRVPTDKTLREWIAELMHEGRMYRFYKTNEWLVLRAKVMANSHNECARCRAKSPSKYTRAETVHHAMEVKRYPELALSMTYRDKGGKAQANLLPLCNRCHNEVHGRYCAAEKRQQLNEERWD